MAGGALRIPGTGQLGFLRFMSIFAPVLPLMVKHAN